MNTKQFIATLLSLAATSAAFAQAPAAGLTRAEVTAEYLRARAAGELATGEADYPWTAPRPASTLTRAQVTAEYLRARAAGELAQGETDYPKMPASVSTLTRAQVIAELVAARKNGEIPMSEADFDVAQTKRQRFLAPN